MSDKTCKERIDDHYDSTMETLRILWAGYCNDNCPECDGDGKVMKNPTSKAKNPKLINCPVCKGEGKLSEDVSDYGSLFEYGLSFDYCYPSKRDAGYFRYQLSWGGPSDEFRIYANQVKFGWEVYRIEYWFMDWFDGASKTLHGEDFKFMKNLIEQFFGDCETMTHEFEKAMENYEPDEEDSEDVDSESDE